MQQYSNKYTINNSHESIKNIHNSSQKVNSKITVDVVNSAQQAN